MPIANDVHGHVFKNSSVVLLARLVGEDGQLVTTSTLSSIEYTIYELDEANPDTLTPVSGHTSVSVTIGSAVFDDLQIDELWSVDQQGYNFRHVLDVSANQAFTKAGVHFLARFELIPTSGQTIVARFKLKAK